jgi:hypothetical protein
MEVADASKRIYDALATISGLHVSRYPPDQVNLPAAFVAPPKETFHPTFDEASSQMTVDVVLLVATIANGLARGYAASEPYRAKSGTKSLYAALEAAVGVWVITADHSAVEYSGDGYIGATFTCGIED